MNNKLLIIVFLITTFLSLATSGCKKEPEDTTKLLIGKWNQASLTTVTYYDNVKQNETNKTYNEGDIVLEIIDDGTAN
ncbi:MAG: hypothetical protein HZB98_08180, partial [Bacteroidia bacterium]|nr:hypothetical protein [Bacteroidia bacterium]